MKTLIIICFALSFVSLYSAEKDANIFFKNKSATIELNGEKCAINFALYKDPVTRKLLTFGLNDNLMSGEITVVPESLIIILI